MAKTGSFDLNFPGATIVCDTVQKRTSLLNFLNGITDTIDVPLSHSDLNQDVFTAVYNTTYYHEAKHFHDHLLCPTLLHNYCIKLDSLYHAILAIHLWNNGVKPYKWIPLPFSHWQNLPLEKKKNLIEKKGIKPSEIPMFSVKDGALLAFGKGSFKDDFSKNLLLGSTEYGEYVFNYGFKDPYGEKTDYNIKSFTESMALVQHLSAIFLKYGKDYGSKLVSNILIDIFSYHLKKKDLSKSERNYDQQGLSIYAGPFYLVNCFLRQENVDQKYFYPLQSYILFWAMSGYLGKRSLWSMHPRNRIEGIAHYAASNNLGLHQDDVISELLRKPLSTFEQWDNFVYPIYKKSDEEMYAILKSIDVNESYSRPTYEHYYKNILIHFGTMVQHLETLGFLGPSFYIQQIAEALLYMKHIFCKHPSLYLYPEAYYYNMDIFVNVPFKFVFSNVDPIKEEECEMSSKKYGFKDNCVYGDSLLSTNKSRIVDWIAYDSTLEYLIFVDALFGDSNINMPGKVIKKFLPGIKTWFFLND